jgi:hypothetical protein
VLVIATIRSDRYELLQGEAHLSAVTQDLFNLPPIAHAEFKTVIEGPARRVSDSGGRLVIEPALTERLIADAQGADALPLLAFTLERLYADYGSEGKLTPAEYEKLGGVQGSIAEAIAHALAAPGRTPAIPAGQIKQLARLRACALRSFRGLLVSIPTAASRCDESPGSRKSPKVRARLCSGSSRRDSFWPTGAPVPISSRWRTKACYGNGLRWLPGCRPMPTT